jgi:hypothetical protein
MAHAKPVKSLPALLILHLLLAATAMAQVPLPPERPRAPARAEPPAAERSAAPCTDLLAADIAFAEITTPVSGLVGAAACGDEAPVQLSAIRLANGKSVRLRPAALARCGTALAFARWVREDLAPAAVHAGLELTGIEIAASYSCRPRNNAKGAPSSEHGRANAIDIGALRVSGGGRSAIGDAQAPAVLFSAMQRSACSRFTTVLGPGSDAAHATHLHVDLAQRPGGYRLCQWTMPDWPLP